MNIVLVIAGANGLVRSALVKDLIATALRLSSVIERRKL